MKKTQSGKLASQSLRTGGRTVCLLICLTLWSGGAAFAASEAPLVKNPPEIPLPQNQVVAPVPQNQAVAPAQPNEVAVPDQQSQSTEDQAAIEEEYKVAEALEKLLESMQMGSFEYQVEDRPDPFMPFISEKIVQSTDPRSSENLSGMRQLEPGQLSLTAILFTETNPMAMVEDSSHKGYVIRRGTRIGKSGIVTDILPNAVIIKVQSSYSTQEQKYTTVEMILRKEGEK